jgi:hypothetical protein
MNQSHVETVRPPPAPIEFAGKWVAWDKRRTKIVASGRTVAAVHAQAIAAGYLDAVLQRVRRPDERFIGAL